MIVNDIIDEYWKRIKKRANVIGYSGDLQNKIKEGKPLPDTSVFRVYVEKKVPLEELDHKDVLPNAVLIKDKCIDIDVVAIGKLRANDNKCKMRPLNAGISTMHKDGTACTINGFFKDNKTGEILVASNNHCFALENKASINDALVQPGPYDGGKCPADTIGKLKKYIEIKFTDFTCPYRNTAIKFTDLFINRQVENKVDIWYYGSTL